MSDDEVSMKISFTEEDAEFLSALQEEVEPVYLGDYCPDYIATEDMASLTWTENSPMAEYEVEIGFTLDGEQISALLLDLRECDDDVYAAIEEYLSNLSGLKELIIALNEEQEMLDISSLTELQYLEVSKPREPMTLPTIDDLTELCAFVISARVTNVPEFSDHSKLQRLVMRSTPATDFPPSICDLEKLVWLEFGDNFDKLPDEALQLTNLVVLDLISDNLSYLPDDIAKLSKLQHVSLETDQLEQLPPTLSELEHITDLYLWNLPYEKLPKQVCELTTLKYLWFKENSKLRGALTSIPEEIGQLKNLVGLQLNGHEIAELPDSIGQLKNLETLNLGINQLTTFNPALLKLHKLKHLELYLNPIEELPDDLGGLRNLEYLDISDTKITDIPESISKLRKLTDFDALGCDLDGLPSSLTNLNYTKIRSFLISLREDPKNLAEDIQDWLEKLVNYANDNIEKGIEVEISLYEPEERDKFAVDDTDLDDLDEDNPALLDDEE